ncbi:cold-shock protein [Saccharomonospora saliphila]|uniref:cold-shock protein n=1 Tax=Saccharomonospora saliphila TaxID=369829 RepID=UPI000361CB95|nr:cold shock domain-containing protein [Saccharomonospora saliphila]
MVTGKVVRFDEFKGYGFVSPDSGGEDVFVHVNDVLFDKTLVAPGVRLSFDIEEGDRGLKASHVRLAEREERPSLRAADGAEDIDEYEGPEAEEPDISGEAAPVTRKQYLDEVTELLLDAAPTATAEDIVSIRRRLVRSAVDHGWVTD